MLKNIMKTVATIIVTVALTVIGVFWWVNQPKPIAERPVDRTITYTVHTGDTIWNVASNFVPDDGDVRLYIWEIERLNGRKLSKIYSGDKIIIPIYREENTK